MRKILKIAGLELSILFYSPVAWLVLTIFMVQCSFSFLDYMQTTSVGLSMGYSPGPLTKILFGGYAGLFTVIQGYLYLYLPILTMGIMSREISSGSIKLLLSSPVKIREIVLGKFFAIAGYGLTLIGIILIYVIIGSNIIKHADLGMIFSGLLALYLLICTYAAIGLFMSCLTSYQIVAAISTLAVFAFLRYVGALWQEVDFIRDLTYFLSLSGRTDKMISGLITTKDVFYYLIIIATFLSLSILRLKSDRELKSAAIKIGRYALLICTALILGYVTSRPILTGYLDTTTGKTLTITKTSQDIAKKFHGELKVTTYANMLAPDLWSVLPASRNTDLGKLEQYKRFISGMNFNYVYYYQKPVDSNYESYQYSPNIKNLKNTDKIAEQMAINGNLDISLFLPPAQINKLIDLRPEGHLLVRKFEYEGRNSFLRFYLVGDSDPYAGEAEVDAALKRLIGKAPKVIFITGNNERNIANRTDRDYQLISALKVRRNTLINQGFDVDTINLNKQNIPDDANIVVLADPTVAFTPVEQQQLSDYINKGGNMLIAGEPGRQQLLNPFLQTLGVKLKPGILVKQDKNLTPGLVNAQLSPQSVTLDSNLKRIKALGYVVAMQGTAGIEYHNAGNFIVKPLLMSANGGWNKQIKTDAGASLVKQATSVALLKSKAKIKKPEPTAPAVPMPAQPAAPAAPAAASPASPASAAATPSPAAPAAASPAAPVQAAPSKMAHFSAVRKALITAQTTPSAATPNNSYIPAASPPEQGAIDLNAADLTFNAAAGDEKGVFPVNISMSRTINGKDQRIIVSGDADFISNGEISRAGRGPNQIYMFGLFRWLNNGAFPVDVTRPVAEDLDMKVSHGQITALMWICKGIIPALIAIWGAITLFKRRRN